MAVLTAAECIDQRKRQLSEALALSSEYRIGGWGYRERECLDVAAIVASGHTRSHRTALQAEILPSEQQLSA